MGILDYPAMPAVTADLASKVSKGSLVINVKDYGAKGDGVTDDRDAILLALASVNAAGGTLYFPPGTYYIGGYSTFTNPGVSQFGRYAFLVNSNVNIVGAGGAILSENIWYDNRRVMFYLVGSSITIDGLTFRNDYDMAGGSRPTSIPIGAGDGFDQNFTSAVKDIRIQNCTFIRSWHPTKFNFNQTGGTATAENITIKGCTARAEPTSTSSGGYNFQSIPAGRIADVSVQHNKCYDVTVSAAIGLYGVQDGTIVGNFLKGSQIDGGGIQLENGSDNVAITGNTLTDHYNHIWIDDSSFVTIAGNTMRNTTTNTQFKGIRITKQGYTEVPDKFVTDITAASNMLRNCFIIAENFGTPVGSPTFGSLIVSNNTVRLDGSTNSSGINLIGSIACTITDNRIIGASLYSINLSPIVNQYVVVTGNITTKAASEASVGFRLANTNAFRPAVGSNVWANGGMSIAQAVNVAIGDTRIYNYTGNPEGAVSAPPGSVLIRSDATDASTVFYVKGTGTGNTGWVAK